MDEDVRLQRARVLGDRTRARLWDELGRSTGLTVADLADRVGVGEATVRKQLDRLVAAGLADRIAVRGRRGRPRWVYRAAAPVAARTVDPYERLASWLLMARADGGPPTAVGRRIGEAVAPTGEPAVPAVVRAMTIEGFAPTVDADPDVPDGAVVTFHVCPYASAARQDPGTVCALHEGFADGIARTAGGVRVTGLEIHDPALAGCRLFLAPDGHGPSD